MSTTNYYSEDRLKAAKCFLESPQLFRFCISLVLFLMSGLILFAAMTDDWSVFRHDVRHTGRSLFTGPRYPAEKWIFTTGNCPISSPVIGTDGTIYIGSWDKKLIAIDPNGTLKWEFTTGYRVDSTPAIGSDGVIYFGVFDGNLYAIKPDGFAKWAFGTGGSIDSSPVISADGSTIYIGSFDGSLYAISKNGTARWAFATGDKIVSSPAIGADGTVYIGSLDNNIYAISPDGIKQWMFSTGDWIESSPAIGADGTIYVGSFDGKLYAINSSDGTQLWSFSTGNKVVSSPAIGSDGTVYVGSLDGYFYAINPDGTQKWAFQTGNMINSSPAIDSEGTIYVGSWDNNFYAIRPDGTLKWSYEIQGGIFSSPAIAADGSICVSSNEGKIYSICEAPQLTAVNLTGNPASPTAVGMDVTLCATPSGGGTPEYQYWVRKPGSPSKTLLRDYSVDNSCPWTPDVAGTYTIVVYAREHWSTIPYTVYKALTYVVKTPLSAVKITGNPISPVAAGTSIKLTATPTGGGTLEYKFLVENTGVPGETVLSDYSLGKTCAWSPSEPGTYSLRVIAREKGSSAECVSPVITFDVKTPLSAVSLTGSLASPTGAGSRAILTATPTGGAVPEYQFWVRLPGSSAKTILREYGLTNTCVWTPEITGSYTLLVYVREKGSLIPYKVYQTLSYQVNPPLSAVSLAASHPSPSVTGTLITLTASPAGGGTPEYQFWIKQSGAADKTLLRDYALANSCSWTPDLVGTYTLYVYVREKGSAIPYKVYTTITYMVYPVLTAVSLAGNPVSPVTAGTNVTLTATPTGGGVPEYQFWVKNPGATSKTLLRNYATINTCAWTPATSGNYTLYVYVRENGSTIPYKVYQIQIYLVT